MRAKFKAYTIVMLILIPCLSYADETQSVTVTADELQIDHKNRKAHFLGNVHAVFEKISLTCNAMGVTYGDDGSFSTLKAEGNVKVKLKDAYAQSGLARLDARLGLLVLEGKPILKQGPHTLHGKRIQIYLKDGKVEVKQAIGTFEIKRGKTN